MSEITEKELREMLDKLIPVYGKDTISNWYPFEYKTENERKELSDWFKNIKKE